MQNKIDIIENYKSAGKPLILDGAMGSLLQAKGLNMDPFLWYSKYNLDTPDIVKALHAEYIMAGADIITTNTFRTNPHALKLSNHRIDQSEMVKKSVLLAIDAREGKNIIIAGSNAPAEDCYIRERTVAKYELEYNHKMHIELLWESGVDIIWNETQSHLDEIEIICKFCSDNYLPYSINFYFDDNLNLLSGERLIDAVEIILGFDPLVIGFNCIKSNILRKFTVDYPLQEYWGFYLNCGNGNVTDEQLTCGITPEEYIDSIKSLLDKHPIFVGSCCGSSPSHTKAIRKYFDEIYRN